ncbi:MAG: AMP-binding protein, partial [Neisseriaceae bacterium]|nr:AMP-binding protein [Neisseriaceae bacterium]
DPRDIKNLIKVLKNHQVTVLTGVNTLFNALIHTDEFKSVDFSSWKLTVSGGAVTQRAVAEQWIEITKLPLIEVYGLTEASPGVCANPLNIKTFTGMIGLPIPNTDVKLCDSSGKEVAVGEVGELKVKGPQVMKGYWDNPTETAAVLDADGFLATGDIGVMNEWGFIQLIDRKKDMVNVSGFNVYPNEIEDVVVAMDGIREAACIGIADEKTGEALKLFAVKSDNSITEQDVTDHCRKELTAYKVPKVIEFRNDLPKSSVGKILRRELREECLLNK